VKELQSLTGYIRGRVTALAGKKDYPVYVDETIELGNEPSLPEALTRIVIEASGAGSQLPRSLREPGRQGATFHAPADIDPLPGLPSLGRTQEKVTLPFRLPE
jgi:hypothetical protein